MRVYGWPHKVLVSHISDFFLFLENFAMVFYFYNEGGEIIFQTSRGVG